MRRSPLGIRNQGTSAVFISCSLPADIEGDQARGVVIIEVTNFGIASATVNCTMTAGSRVYGLGSVAGTSGAIPARDNGYVYYASVDKMSFSGSFNFSCVLPPDVELNTISVLEGDAGNGR